VGALRAARFGCRSATTVSPHFERIDVNHEYGLFERFSPMLRSSGENAACSVGEESGYAVHYVPFEYVNAEARFVLVGITPGPKQIECAYRTAQRLLGSVGTRPAAEVLLEIKRSCSFAGMRDKINEMLEHFGIPARVNVVVA
jgi:hypothetical protein